MADIVGLCNICGRPGAMHTCHLCGRIVCNSCYNLHHGVCIECGFQRRRSNTPINPMD